MIKEIALEDRFQEVLKEAALKVMEAGTGMNLDFARDIFTAARMLKEGYPLKEVLKELKKLFMKRTGSTDAKAANLYVDKVLGKVNEQLKNESRDDIPRAYDELEKHLSTDKLRLKNLDGKPLTSSQKGNILARMMVVDGFSLAAVEEAASQSKALGFTDEEELKQALSSCKEISSRYKAISDIPLKSRVETYGDMYKQYAKEYMEQTGTAFLTPQDDEKILATLCMEIRYAVQQDLPNNDKGRKQLDDYMKTEILPGCSKAVQEASPVAAEGWRNKSQYIPCVMYGTEHFSELMKDTEEKYQKTQSIVQGFLAGFDQEQDEARRIYPETTLDTELAKELIFERQSEPLIKRAVEEHTRIGGRDNFIDRNFKDKEAYASAILRGAKDSYSREQHLLFSARPQIPQLSYAQLKEQNITANDLYLEAVKERLDIYPTFRLHMADPSVDEELAAAIVTKHPDVDLDELKTAIEENSPRAAILGISDNYAETVVRHAKTELEQVDKRERQALDQKMLFNKSRGFAQVAFSEDPMEDYQNCKVAMEMLQDNIPEVDIRQMIKDIAPQEGLSTNPELYATMIVGTAKRVLERSDNILKYRKDPTVPVDMQDLYMEKAQKILQKKGFPDSNMDVEVYKQLKLEGRDESDIQAAVKRYSPSAIEAGRDEASYCEFVKSSADFKINEEKEKLDNYLVIPRLEDECTPDEEYEFQRKKMTDYISLPFNPAFDTKLARGLLEKKMEEDKVADVLDRLSPMAGSRTGDEPSVGSYGRSRVAEALQSMKRVLVNEEVHENTKVTQHDFGLVKTTERALVRTYATQTDGQQED